jgi:exodeoxyribonuclease V alpha subunit
MNDSSPQTRTPSEEIAGLVERVTFFNEESGFAVLRVKVRAQRELVIVLGSLPSISDGELTAKGFVGIDDCSGWGWPTALSTDPQPLQADCIDKQLRNVS